MNVWYLEIIVKKPKTQPTSENCFYNIGKAIEIHYAEYISVFIPHFPQKIFEYTYLFYTVSNGSICKTNTANE